MNVAILVPVLRRPAQVRRVIDNITDTTPEPHRILFIADVNDWEERVALDRAGAEYITTDQQPPNYPRKVNLGFHATTEPFVFLAADDLKFHHGWLHAALAAMGPGVGMVGTNDGGANKRVSRGEHATHMLVRRAYVEQMGATFDAIPGEFAYEGYQHVYVDDELVQAAVRRYLYAHAFDSLVEHLHPYAGKAELDDVYRIGQANIRADKRMYHQRDRLRRRLQCTPPSWLEPSELPGGLTLPEPEPSPRPRVRRR